MIASDTLFVFTVSIGVEISDEDIVEIDNLGVVAMATNFGTNIAINWLCVDDSD